MTIEKSTNQDNLKTSKRMKKKIEFDDISLIRELKFNTFPFRGILPMHPFQCISANVSLPMLLFQ